MIYQDKVMEMLYDGGDIGVFALFGLLPVIFYLVLFVFLIYFVIKTVKFMEIKIKLDQEKNEKINELIQLINQKSE